METVIPTPARPEDYCKSCAAKIVNDDAFCTTCGYPLKGTEKEQTRFIRQHANAMTNMVDFKKKVDRASNLLYYLSAAFLLIAVITYAGHQDDPDILTVVLQLVILTGIFLALGSYSHKKPLACFVSGLCLYVIVQVIDVVNNPSHIAHGILWKIAVIVYLVIGIRSAVDVERLKKEHNIT
jgi:hypothetical protein